MSLLKDSAKRTTSLQWPNAVDERLDTLRALASLAGVQMSRAQLLAALVLAAPLDVGNLGALARTYLSQRADDFEGSPETLQDLPALNNTGPKRGAA